jgi:hypothetical protein
MSVKNKQTMLTSAMTPWIGDARKALFEQDVNSYWSYNQTD